MKRPKSEPIHPAIPERLIQAAVQAGLDAVREPLASAVRLGCMAAVSDEWADEPSPVDRRGARRLQPVASVVGFDSPSAEGTGHVPWFAD